MRYEKQGLRDDWISFDGLMIKKLCRDAGSFKFVLECMGSIVKNNNLK